MEYLSDKWLCKWATENCKSKEELDALKKAAETEALKVISDKLDNVEITVEPIVFDASEFSNAMAFSKAMFICGERYSETDDVLVRYTKPENKETHEVSVQFHVLKSKAKMFQKFMSDTNGIFEFAVETSNEIKSCVKFFNSLGVKGEDGEPLSSKETDYAKDMKDALKKGENKVFVIVKNEEDYILLEWNLVGADYECSKFEDVKTKIDSIIKN